MMSHIEEEENIDGEPKKAEFPEGASPQQQESPKFSGSPKPPNSLKSPESPKSANATQTDKDKAKKQPVKQVGVKQATQKSGDNQSVFSDWGAKSLKIIKEWLMNWGRGENLTGLLVVVLLGVVLLIIVRYPIKFDLTSSNINTLSKVSKTLVSDLRDPMRIKVFVSPNLPPPFNTLEQSLRDVLNEYRQTARGNFYYTFYRINEKQADEDPKMQENIDLAKSYNIYPQSIQTIDKDEVKLVNVYSGLVIEYGNVIERIDFIADSEALEYRLSSLFKKVTDKVNTLLSMKENIRVTLYLGDNFVELAPFFGISGLGEVVGELKDTIEELGRENYSKLDFEHKADAITDEQRAFLSELEAQTYPWSDFTANGKNYGSGIGTALLLIEHQERTEVLELLSREEVIQITGKGLERIARYQVIPVAGIKDRLDGLVNNILEITPPLSYLKDNATVDLVQGDFQASPQNPQGATDGANFGAILATRYQLVNVSLTELSPQLYPVFMLAGVKEPLTEYELFLIDQYLMKGGSLVVMYDSFKEEGGQGFGGNSIPQWIKNETGLEKLIEHYGVRIDSSIVMDKVSFVSRNQSQGSAATEQQVYYVPLIENQNINSDLAYLDNVKGIFFIAGSPLFPVEEVLTANNIRAERLFSSSAQSWNVSEDVTLVPYLIQPPTDEKDYTSFDLAYMLEGSFPSYFKGKDIPEKETSTESEADETDLADAAGAVSETAPKPKANANNANKTKAVQQFSGEATATTIVGKSPDTSQIFIIGSSEIIKNNVVDSAGKYPNAIMLLNVIDAINGEVDWAVMRAKGQRVNPLDVKVSAEGGLVIWWKRPTFIKTVNLVGLPVLIVLFGLWMYLHKMRLRRRVAERFSGVPNAGVPNESTE